MLPSGQKDHEPHWLGDARLCENVNGYDSDEARRYASNKAPQYSFDKGLQDTLSKVDNVHARISSIYIELISLDDCLLCFGKEDLCCLLEGLKWV